VPNLQKNSIGFMKKESRQNWLSVDDYFAGQTEKSRLGLEKMRKAIKAIVPDAEEVISYQIPTFKLKGPVAAIAAFENHCSYYTMSHSVMAALKEELKGYKTSGVTIHFAPEKPLPAALVKKLVLAKLQENEFREAQKKKAK
jgi:uncharacterized protein YdhG (YjbR/CyaY superfamily)